MYPIDLVKYTNTKKKIPSEILASAADIYPDKHKGLFKSYLRDGFIMFWAANALGQIITLQISSYLIGNMQIKAMLYSGIFGLQTMLFAPLIGCMYFAFSYYLNHGQSYGLHCNKRKFQFESSSFKQVTRFSIYSSLVSSMFGLPLLSKKFVAWAEKTIGFRYQAHDDLYHELFVPKNEWAPSLVAMINSDIKAHTQPEEEFSYSQAA